MTNLAPDDPGTRSEANWAKPVDRLSATGVAGAKDDAVSGKRVPGPLQGFGQLWQKTFKVAADRRRHHARGGHRDLEGTVRDVLAEVAAVLRAAVGHRAR